MKNYQSVQVELGFKRTITKIEFNTYRPVGEISVINKSEKVPVTGIILNVIHVVNWINCCKKLESQQNNDDENEEDNEE